MLSETHIWAVKEGFQMLIKSKLRLKWRVEITTCKFNILKVQYNNGFKMTTSRF